ncbi:MAG: hypothetical protein AAGJ19_03160 [Myxococcota bacterium]
MQRMGSLVLSSSVLAFACVEEPNDLGPSERPIAMDDDQGPVSPPSEDTPLRLRGFPPETRLIDLDAERGKLLAWPGERRLVEVDLESGLSVTLTEEAALFESESPLNHPYRLGRGGPWSARFTASGGVVFFEGEAITSSALDGRFAASDAVLVVRGLDGQTLRVATKVGLEPTDAGIPASSHIFDTYRPLQPSQVLLREDGRTRLVALDTLEVRDFGAVELTDRILWLLGGQIRPGFTFEAPLRGPRLEGDSSNPSEFVGEEGSRQDLPFLDPESPEQASWSHQVWCDANDGALRRLDLVTGEIRQVATTQGSIVRQVLAVGARCHGLFLTTEPVLPADDYFLVTLSQDDVRNTPLPTLDFGSYALRIRDEGIATIEGQSYAGVIVGDEVIPLPRKELSLKEGVELGASAIAVFDIEWPMVLSRVDRQGLEVIFRRSEPGRCPVARVNGVFVEAWDRGFVSWDGFLPTVLNRRGQALVCEPDADVEGAWRLMLVDVGQNETLELRTEEPLRLWSDETGEGRAIFVGTMAVIAARTEDAQTELLVFRF